MRVGEWREHKKQTVKENDKEAKTAREKERERER